MTELQRFVTEVFDGFRASRTVQADVMPLVDGLQERLSTSMDLDQDARVLYSVRGAEDFSIGLLWALSLRNQPGNGDALGDEVMQRLYAGLDRLFGVETTPTLVTSLETPVQAAAEFAEPAEDPFPASAESAPPEDTTKPSLESESAPVMEESAPAVQLSGPASPETLGGVLEKFIESIQAGSDDRAQLLDEVQGQCSGLSAARSDDASLSSYLAAVADFLSYIKTNDLLDDIRVMNIVTNFQEPYAQWLSAPEGGREGILEQGVEFLADFRAMFE